MTSHLPDLVIGVLLALFLAKLLWPAKRKPEQLPPTWRGWNNGGPDGT